MVNAEVDVERSLDAQEIKSNHIAHQKALEYGTNGFADDEEYTRQVELLNKTIEGAEKYRQAMAAHWQGNGDETAGVPDADTLLTHFVGTLRDYQADGVQFLVNKFFYGESCILADEMGLGKTIQVIAFTCWLREFEVTELEEEMSPILIAVPLSTAYNWIKEYERFAPHLPTILYYGSINEREEQWKQIKQQYRTSHKIVNSITTRLKDLKKSKKQLSSTEHKKLVEKKRKAMPPIVITNYAKVVHEVKTLEELQWGVLVVDEGQCVKNPASLLKSRLSQLAPVTMNSLTQPMRILLTGTPIGNDLLELWSLCNFVMPQVFVDSGMADKVYGFSHIEELEGKELVVARQKADMIVSKLRQLLAWYMLRRTKEGAHLKLPPKGEVVIYCDPSPEQAKLAAALIDGTAAQVAEDMGWAPINERNAHFRSSSSTPSSATSTIDSEMTDMMTKEEQEAFLRDLDSSDDEQKSDDDSDHDTSKRASSHRKRPRKPSVHTKSKSRRAIQPIPTTRSASRTDLSANVQQTFEEAVPRSFIPLNNRLQQLRKVYNHPYLVAEPRDMLLESITDERIVTHSGKMRVLDKMLRYLKKFQHKVIIFSQYKIVLNCLEDYLRLHQKQFGEYRRLDGDVDSIDRARYMDEFNTDKDIFLFLASTRAGGLGVNLIGADTVIIYDSDWNPNQDSQAQDRVHRIGQTKPVMVYRLITASEVERYMLRKHMSKKGLQRMILDEGPSRQVSDLNDDAASTVSEPCSTTEDSFQIESDDVKSKSNHDTMDTKRIRPTEAKLLSSLQHIPVTVTEPLLRHWLRDDVHGRTTGVSDQELSWLLHRPTALYAARAKALEVEKEAQLALAETNDKHQTNNHFPSTSNIRVPTSDIGKPRKRLEPAGKGYEFVYQSAALAQL